MLRPGSDVDAWLAHRWAVLSDRAGITTGASGVFEQLRVAYSEEHRRYHTLTHVAWTLFRAGRIVELEQTADTIAVELAVWFHDFVYDTRRSDNEHRSAVIARRLLSRCGVAATVVDDVAFLVEATADHRVPDGRLAGPAAILLDADLSILSAPRAVYQAYARDVRAEYRWVPEPDYRAGRTRVLESLRRGRVYSTAAMASREPAAQANLAWELDQLAGA